MTDRIQQVSATASRAAARVCGSEGDPPWQPLDSERQRRLDRILDGGVSADELRRGRAYVNQEFRKLDRNVDIDPPEANERQREVMRRFGAEVECGFASRDPADVLRGSNRDVSLYASALLQSETLERRMLSMTAEQNGKLVEAVAANDAAHPIDSHLAGDTLEGPRTAVLAEYIAGMSRRPSLPERAVETLRGRFAETVPPAESTRQFDAAYPPTYDLGDVDQAIARGQYAIAVYVNHILTENDGRGAGDALRALSAEQLSALYTGASLRVRSYLTLAMLEGSPAIAVPPAVVEDMREVLFTTASYDQARVFDDRYPPTYDLGNASEAVRRGPRGALAFFGHHMMRADKDDDAGQRELIRTLRGVPPKTLETLIVRLPVDTRLLVAGELIGTANSPPVPLTAAARKSLRDALRRIDFLDSVERFDKKYAR